MIYLSCTTFIFESGQSWKTAALKIPKCVCFFYTMFHVKHCIKNKVMFHVKHCGGNMDEKYLELALIEAKKAEIQGEIPVGCIIVKNDKIISKAYNNVEKKKNCICHAEILAIKKASKKLKNWRLNDCIIYTTLEPCMMCCGAILHSRIKKIVYSAKNINNGYTDKLNNINIKYIKNDKYENMIKTFFKNKR